MAINWTTPTSLGDYSRSQLDSLSDATLSGSFTIIDNTTSKHTHMTLAFTLGSLNPTGTPYMSIFGCKSWDGTNYQDTPATGGANTNTLLGTIPFKTGTALKREALENIPILPCKYAIYVDNQLNVSTVGTGNSVDVYTYTLEDV